MRPLLIDDEAKERAAKVVAYAKGHPLRLDSQLGRAQPFVPGEDQNYVANLSSYRCVFTFTHVDGLVYRHMSVSVPGALFPNPAAVFTLADLFGFTGWDQKTTTQPPKGWMLALDDRAMQGCIVVAQVIGSDPDMRH